VSKWVWARGDESGGASGDREPAVRTVPLPIRSTRRGTNGAALLISRRVVLY
jgi:hypothetical protein